MAEFKIVARPWQPQDLIDDLQMMIDEEPDSITNGRRTTLCMARDYLKDFFAADVVEVVRCVHCKHATLSSIWPPYCDKHKRAVKEEGFCSDGERRANDGRA